MRLFLAFFISIFLLQGCFIANEFFIEPEAGNESSTSLQTRTEDKIKLLLGSDSLIPNYEAYGFSAVKIIKPYEIDSLEKLQLIQPKNAADSSQIKSLT
ncbi:hypothetical protein [Crocinitomix catalasitica]|uniref:hypothetical protein n=1 Tax=Crocinitomix catalasitica TaxID=184607 RepID=UPI00048560C6|nr:hypothetical protein [Crocinitomix catalasitica]